ncbi:zinc finger protein [Abeliophyllum distichum]|uniref:Zinc finger protein n=1 Tax=Abeliophyllum distichum TaxID=126358 RepID=A0ABD1Q804_9LAMI
MKPVSVLVYYDGEWNHSWSYDAYAIVGKIVPLECSYVKLVKIIMKELQWDQSQHAIKIQYQVMDDGLLIKICSDISVYFYIQVKKTESNLTKFPLSVDVENVVYIEDNQICLGNAVTSEDNSGHSQEVNA